jgi:nucleotide-binding universal stress UspA family protein
LDIDEAAGAAIAQSFKVIPPPRPRMTVIHAYDAPHRGLVYSGISEESLDEYLDHYRDEAVEKIEKLINATLKREKLPPSDTPTWKSYIQYGAPRTVIPAAVKKAETDLLVLGTRGRSGLAYAFLGTVAGSVLRAVSCDVLVVPPSSRR